MAKMRAVSLLLILLSSMSAWATKAPWVLFPDDARVTVIGEQLTVFGLPLMAYEFHSAQSVAELVAFYTSEWSRRDSASDEAPPYIESELAGWRVLSHLELGHNITVQLRDGGIRGTQVLVGVSPLPDYLTTQRRNRIDVHVPLLGGTRMTSLVASVDRGQRAEVYWLISDDSVDTFLGRYRDHHQQRGATVNGYRVVQQERHRAQIGTLQVSEMDGSFRYDAMVGDDGKTRVTAIWRPQ